MSLLRNFVCVRVERWCVCVIVGETPSGSTGRRGCGSRSHNCHPGYDRWQIDGQWQRSPPVH